MGKVGKQNKHRKWDDFEKNRSRIRKMQFRVPRCIFASRYGKPAIGLPAARLYEEENL